jgi:hypothetical protein
MAQALGFWLLAVAARVQSDMISYETRCGRSDIEAGFNFVYSSLGEVRQNPLGTSATIWPPVSALDDR